MGLMLARRVLLVSVLAWLTLACGGGEDRGGPLPQQFPGETYPAVRIEVTGAVTLSEDGCLLFESGDNLRLAVWPPGSRADGDSVVLLDGRRVRPGDTIRVVAGLFPVVELVEIPGEFWSGALARCTPDAEDVVVIDEVTVPG